MTTTTTAAAGGTTARQEEPPSSSSGGASKRNVQWEFQQACEDGEVADELSLVVTGDWQDSAKKPETSILVGIDPVEFKDTEKLRRDKNRLAAGVSSSNDSSPAGDGACAVTPRGGAAPRNAEVDQGTNDLFLSHCWRGGPRLQDIKRHLVREISAKRKSGAPGYTYWADYLDLQASGPVPWRREIEDGVKGAAKVICYIDEEYLQSFNCLQEVAFSIQYNKALVPVIIDEASAHLLYDEDAAIKLWGSDKNDLSDYEGCPLTDRQKFTPEALSGLFARLRSLDACHCLVQDIGWQHVLKSYLDVIDQDMQYLREYRDLEIRADAWDSKGRHNRDILRGGDVERWRMWVKSAEDLQQIPAPTQLHHQFLRASSVYRKYIITALLVLVVLGVALVCGATAAALVFSQQAQSAQAEASKTTNMATILLLTHNKYPSTSAEMRVAMAGSSLADSLKMPSLVLGAMHSAIWYLSTLPHQFFELGRSDAGHGGSVTAVTFSPDGSYLASASSDNTMLVWSLPEKSATSSVPQDFAPAEQYTCEVDGVYATPMTVAWSPDGQFIAGGTEDGSLCLWDASAPGGSTATVISAHKASVVKVAFHSFLSGGGYTLASASADSTIALWQVSVDGLSMQQLHRASSADGCDAAPLADMAWNYQGTWLVTGTSAGCIMVYAWDGLSASSTLELLLSFDALLETVGSITVSPSALAPQLAVSGKSSPGDDDDASVQVWALNSLVASADATSHHLRLTGLGAETSALEWSQNGTHLVASYGDAICFWDLTPYVADAILLELHLAGLSSSEAMQDLSESQLDMAILQTALGNDDLEQVLANETVVSELAAAVYEWDSTPVLEPHLEIDTIAAGVDGLAWHGTRLAKASSDLTVGVYEMDPQQVPRQVQSHTLMECGDTEVTGIAYTPCKRFVAMGLEDGWICMYSFETGSTILKQMAHTDKDGDGEEINYMDWSPDGRLLVSGGKDELARLWSWSEENTTLVPLETFGTGESVHTVEFNKDGTMFAYCSDDYYVVISVDGDSFEEIWRCPTTIKESRTLRWDASGLLAAKHATTEVYIFHPRPGNSTETCVPVHALDIGYGGVKNIDMSPDGTMLAAISSRRVVVWTADSELRFAGTTTEAVVASRTALLGHTREIHGIRFSQDGSMIATASRVDTMLRLWDTAKIVANQGTECISCALWEILDTDCAYVQFDNDAQTISCMQTEKNTGNYNSSPLSPRYDVAHGTMLVHSFTVNATRAIPVLEGATYGSLTQLDVNVLGYSFMSGGDGLIAELVSGGKTTS